MITFVRGVFVPMFVACLTRGIASAQQGIPTKRTEMVVRSHNGEEGDMQDDIRGSQLDLSGNVEWKEQLERLIFDARFVTGKEMVALDSLFPDKPLTGKEGRSDVDLYLVIRIQTGKRLSFFPGPLTVEMIADNAWPFSQASLPDAVTIPPMGSKEGVVYFTKHLWGDAQRSRVRFNKVLTSTRWKFQVIEAHFK